MKFLKITQHINEEEACKNICYYNKSDFDDILHCYISIKHYILYCEHRDYVKVGEIKINKIHRIEFKCNINTNIQILIIENPQIGCKILDKVDLLVYRKKYDGLQPLYISRTKLIKKFLEIMENKISMPDFVMGIRHDEKLLFTKIIVTNPNITKFIINKKTKINIIIQDKKKIKLQTPKVYSFVPTPDCDYIYDIKIECDIHNKDYIKHIVFFLGGIYYSTDEIEYHSQYGNIIKFPMFERLGNALPIFGLMVQKIIFYIFVDTYDNGNDSKYKIHYNKVYLQDKKNPSKNNEIIFTTSNQQFIYTFGYVTCLYKQDIIKPIGFSTKIPDGDWMQTYKLIGSDNIDNKKIDHNLPEIQNKKISMYSDKFNV